MTKVRFPVMLQVPLVPLTIGQQCISYMHHCFGSEFKSIPRMKHLPIINLNQSQHVVIKLMPPIESSTKLF
ncbi:hypothetical protein KUTeg_014423 [Tegillarca granosa]|uniref:Uncharacterized protein n=1 Tax=Tegillarca granosa TaxID=220873 RepID=A0ABQ9EWI9_TEGGR|nr:hypothetical protein KUTeg_014423 [Tegillarca granosa]